MNLPATLLQLHSIRQSTIWTESQVVVVVVVFYCCVQRVIVFYSPQHSARNGNFLFSPSLSCVMAPAVDDGQANRALLIVPLLHVQFVVFRGGRLLLPRPLHSRGAAFNRSTHARVEQLIVFIRNRKRSCSCSCNRVIITLLLIHCSRCVDGGGERKGRRKKEQQQVLSGEEKSETLPTRNWELLFTGRVDYVGEGEEEEEKEEVVVVGYILCALSWKAVNTRTEPKRTEAKWAVCVDRMFCQRQTVSAAVRSPLSHFIDMSNTEMRRDECFPLSFSRTPPLAYCTPPSPPTPFPPLPYLCRNNRTKSDTRGTLTWNEINTNCRRL